jgi:PhnB protein
MAEHEHRYSPVAPYLMVHDGRAAIEHYKSAFGAEESERYDHAGKVGHVTLRINGADVMLSDEFPEHLDTVGTLSPKTLGGTTITISLAVDDVDRWYERATQAGMFALRPPKDEFYGRNAKLRDPFGHVWSLTGPNKGTNKQG